MIYIGVDPGMTGYVAVLQGKDTVVLLEPFPLVEVTKGRTLNIPGLYHLMYGIKHPTDMVSHTSIIAGVERVGPTQGAKAMFHFGGTYFAMQTALSFLEIQYHLIEPKAWLSHFKLSGTTKDKSRVVAGRLFPSIPLTYKKDTDKAEALLIARYMAEKFEVKVSRRKV